MSCQLDPLKKTKESFSENPYTACWIENNIVYLAFKPELKTIDLPIAKKIVETRMQVSNGIDRPLLVDLSAAAIIDKPSRKYWAESEALKYVTASALLVKTTFHRIATSFYINFDKPCVPTKVFTDSDTALHWLERFKAISIK